MFRIIFCVCWKTENKTCLDYVLGITQGVSFKLQVRANYRKEESESTEFD